MAVTVEYKKLGTEIYFTPLLSFTFAKISFTRLRSTALNHTFLNLGSANP